MRKISWFKVSAVGFLLMIYLVYSFTLALNKAYAYFNFPYNISGWGSPIYNGYGPGLSSWGSFYHGNPYNPSDPLFGLVPPLSSSPLLSGTLDLLSSSDWDTVQKGIGLLKSYWSPYNGSFYPYFGGIFGSSITAPPPDLSGWTWTSPTTAQYPYTLPGGGNLTAYISPAAGYEGLSPYYQQSYPGSFSFGALLSLAPYNFYNSSDYYFGGAQVFYPYEFGQITANPYIDKYAAITELMATGTYHPIAGGYSTY